MPSTEVNRSTRAKSLSSPQSSSKDSRISKRRPHRKSRNGCRTCKVRRVKCDETHPRCENCSHLGLTCSFQTAAMMLETDPSVAATVMNGIGERREVRDVRLEQSSKSSGIRSLQSEQQAQAALNAISKASILSAPTASAPGISLELDDLKLMYVYATSVHASLAAILEGQEEIFKAIVPQLAFQSESLMHSLLAFTGTYLAFCSKSGSVRTEYEQRAAYHRAGALAALKSTLQSKLHGEEADKALMTAYLLTADSIANVDTLADAEASNSPTTLTTTQFLLTTRWVHIVRALLCILKSTWPLKPNSLLHALFSEDFCELPVPRSKLDFKSFAQGLRPFSIKDNFILNAQRFIALSQHSTSPYSSFNRKPKSEKWLYDDEDDLFDIYPLTGNSPYLVPCFMISKLKTVIVSGRKRVMSLIFAFIGLLDEKFYSKFHANDVIAHRIVAEFYRTVRIFARSNGSDVWWMRRIANGLEILTAPVVASV
ncbi:uncharacterized protein V1516DRAFT_622174 [Lipomyces oligophaga]|uniref:uncharacterized protein n=1 Tax=Lipomyces oligophaga TaxID=45792 RepID=UPI0034CF447A